MLPIVFGHDKRHDFHEIDEDEKELDLEKTMFSVQKSWRMKNKLTFMICMWMHYESVGIVVLDADIFEIPLKL